MNKYWQSLAREGPATTAELAARLGVKVSTATVMVAQLKAAGEIAPVGEVPNAKRRRPVVRWGLPSDR